MNLDKNCVIGWVWFGSARFGTVWFGLGLKVTISNRQHRQENRIIDYN